MSKMTNSKITKLEKALATYNALISFEPDNHKVYEDKAEVLSELGRYIEAIESYSKAIDLDPNNRICLAQRAKMYGLNNQPGLAVQDWEKISTFPRTKDFEQSDLDDIVRDVKAIPCVQAALVAHNYTTTLQGPLDTLTVLGDVA